MAVSFTLRNFPITGELKDECGLPLACLVQPFAKYDAVPLDRPCRVKANDVARCIDCYAYINRYCHLERVGWTCALCGQYNEIASAQHRKYGISVARSQVPELRTDLVEMECDPLDGADSDSDTEDAAVAEVEAVPVYVALVDVCCEEETLELVRSAVQGALEALPPAARFGLLTYSTRLGVLEVGGDSPSVRYVALREEDDGDAPTAVQLEEALPLSSLLACVGDSKDAITVAIEALQPEPFDPPADGEPEALRGGRAFGAAIQSVLRYLSGAIALQERRASGAAASTSASAASANGAAASIAGAYAGARLLAFLAGPPNRGRGRVFHRQCHREEEGQPAGPTASSIIIDPMMADLNPYTFSMPAVPQQQQPAAEDDDTPGQIVVNPDAREFYEEAGAAAASLAVCVDLFAISPHGCGLASLEPLVAATGGALFLYPAVEDAALPQDMYKRVGAPLARGGLLRLRTTPDFRVSTPLGHSVFPDDQLENLFHLVSTDPNDTFAFELEYSRASGLREIEGQPPSLQMVFQYSILLPAGSRGPEGSPSPQRFVLQRRMRVLTVPIPIASSPRHVFDGCNADAVLKVLLHKLIQAAEEDGSAEGHALLQDWLAILAAQYNRHILGLSAASGAQADVAFEAVEALQAVPRAVYGLLRSPLLVRRPGGHPDAATAARLLWSGLPAGELRRAVYPLLSSFSSPDAQAFPRHSLSQAALATSGAPIYLLDSYTAVLVYYTAAAASVQPPLAFPPPQGSMLRQAINVARANRRMLPHLRLLRSGVDDDRLFYDCLIEEPDDTLAAAGAEAGRGFVMFLDSVKREVQEILKQMD